MSTVFRAIKASSDHVSDHSHGSTPLKASELLERPTVDKTVDAPQRARRELF